MMPRKRQILRVLAGAICAVSLIVILYRDESLFLTTSYQRSLSSPKNKAPSLDTNEDSVGVGVVRRFAVFSCATPDENQTHRGFDYAFYLPLTVVAWRRIGFESIVLIVGEKSEWRAHPILTHVLVTLQRLSDVTVLFLSAQVENRLMLSQVARICVANMKEFPGRSSDFVLTTDADLWPLRKEHYYQPEGMNRSKLLLLHSDCCGSFTLGGRSYTMLPINVGASAGTWQEIINARNSSSAAAVSTTMTEADDILNYFQQVFGKRARKSVAYASDDWYMDQKMMSVRIDQWIDRQQSSSSSINQSIYHKVSDSGFSRIDRINWNADEIQPTLFENYYDAHLILDGYLPVNWKSIQPLLHLMYGNTSTLYEFCNRYATEFYTQFTKWEANKFIRVV